MTTKPRTLDDIEQVDLIVGMEIHVELATKRKMFSGAPNPAAPSDGTSREEPEPNTLIDPTVLGLPGALPVMNKRAVELSMMVGAALGCRISEFTKWDRKSYFYPDLPKAYQISQYDLPLCYDGAFDLPSLDAEGRIDPQGPERRIGIIRAHLEEDAGKLLHEAPGGRAIEGSIVDLNRAGTPLLEIVTQPDLRSADECVAFARILRDICRSLGASEGVLQQGHIRFEPNINTKITFFDRSTATTPIVEVKNLNSYRSLRLAIEHELAEQPRRYLQDGREMGPGMKTTRGWDDKREVTFSQREKEDAHDYRYFPDPDLPPVVIDDAWRERICSQVGELPHRKQIRYMDEAALSPAEAQALTAEPGVAAYYEAIVELLIDKDDKYRTDREHAGRAAANLLLQSGAKHANERGVSVDRLGVSPQHAAEIIFLREDGRISAQGLDELFGLYASGEAGDETAESLAESRGMIVVRDEGALEAWCDEVIAEHPAIAEQIKGGKDQAIGRLIGEVMKKSKGQADAKTVREMLMDKLKA
ncbi:MAG: Asp-tRNA(Asn)/Glu-tRNA(Gln) amidotransferase subunit GatB [Phycisphaerales bacterium]|nr:Asp-tRNA(Asn)/Glu-tRNA(Gln) amidotransferase subunit GatB [Phycisphaerales bacterium]